MSKIDKGEPRSLYVYRKVRNADEILAWAREQGFANALAADDLHVTVIYTRSLLDWTKIDDAWASDEDGGHRIKPGGPRSIEEFSKGAVVLAFADSTLAYRHRSIREMGAVVTYDEYTPHITITYDKGDLDLDKVTPYRGRIDLGPEIFEEIKQDFSPDDLKEPALKILKIDEMERIVFGWGSVISEKGVPLVDLQGHVIEADEILKATTEFMLSERTSLNMHKGEKVGTVVHSFPLTKDIAASLGVQSDLEGWIVGVKIHDEEVWKKVVNHDLRAFSIGAKAVLEEI